MDDVFADMDNDDDGAFSDLKDDEFFEAIEHSLNENDNIARIEWPKS